MVPRLSYVFAAILAALVGVTALTNDQHTVLDRTNMTDIERHTLATMLAESFQDRKCS